MRLFGWRIATSTSSLLSRYTGPPVGEILCCVLRRGHHVQVSNLIFRLSQLRFFIGASNLFQQLFDSCAPTGRENKQCERDCSDEEHNEERHVVGLCGSFFPEGFQSLPDFVASLPERFKLKADLIADTRGIPQFPIQPHSAFR